jgi:hypothetical protein
MPQFGFDLTLHVHNALAYGERVFSNVLENASIYLNFALAQH